MYCSECGSNNSADAKFCNNCGSVLKAETTSEQSESTPAEVSPDVDQVDQDVVFCTKCGAKLSPGTSFCGQCGQSLVEVEERRPAHVPSQTTPFPLKLSVGAMVSGVGAILMLISLAVPWYAIRVWGGSDSVSASDLINRDENIFGNLYVNWAGMSLPVILVIVFASLALLAIVFSAVGGLKINRLLNWFGSLSLLCVMGNALYFLFWLYDKTGELSYESEWVNIVHAGSVMAFVGALVMILGSRFGESQAFRR